MQQGIKYKRVEPTLEEKEAFLKAFEELCLKHSMYFEPVPALQRKEVNSPWEIVSQVVLLKNIQIAEEIPSPFESSPENNELPSENI